MNQKGMLSKLIDRLIALFKKLKKIVKDYIVDRKGMHNAKVIRDYINKHPDSKLEDGFPDIISLSGRTFRIVPCDDAMKFGIPQNIWPFISDSYGMFSLRAEGDNQNISIPDVKMIEYYGELLRYIMDDSGRVKRPEVPSIESQTGDTISFSIGRVERMASELDKLTERFNTYNTTNYRITIDESDQEKMVEYEASIKALIESCAFITQFIAKRCEVQSQLLAKIKGTDDSMNESRTIRIGDMYNEMVAWPHSKEAYELSKLYSEYSTMQMFIRNQEFSNQYLKEHGELHPELFDEGFKDKVKELAGAAVTKGKEFAGKAWDFIKKIAHKLAVFFRTIAIKLRENEDDMQQLKQLINMHEIGPEDVATIKSEHERLLSGTPIVKFKEGSTAIKYDDVKDPINPATSEIIPYVKPLYEGTDVVLDDKTTFVDVNELDTILYNNIMKPYDKPNMLANVLQDIEDHKTSTVFISLDSGWLEHFSEDMEKLKHTAELKERSVGDLRDSIADNDHTIVGRDYNNPEAYPGITIDADEMRSRLDNSTQSCYYISQVAADVINVYSCMINYRNGMMKLLNTIYRSITPVGTKAKNGWVLPGRDNSGHRQATWEDNRFEDFDDFDDE